MDASTNTILMHSDPIPSSFSSICTHTQGCIDMSISAHFPTAMLMDATGQVYDDSKPKRKQVHHSGQFKKGMIPWNKGKTGIYSEESRRKMSEAIKRRKLRGDRNPMYGKSGPLAPNYGIKFTDEHRQRISQALMGHKPSPEQIEKYKKTRTQWKTPVQNTKSECMMQIALSLNGIPYQPHKLFVKKGFFHRVDLFVEPNICIEVDGKYWHTKPKVVQRDLVVNHELQSMGNFVMRLWDKEVLSDTQGCAEKIIDAIKKLREMRGVG